MGEFSGWWTDCKIMIFSKSQTNPAYHEGGLGGLVAGGAVRCGGLVENFENNFVIFLFSFYIFFQLCFLSETSLELQFNCRAYYNVMLGETWKKKKIDSNCKYNIYNNNNNDNNNNNKIQKIIKVLVILSKILMLLLKENKFYY